MSTVINTKQTLTLSWENYFLQQLYFLDVILFYLTKNFKSSQNGGLIGLSTAPALFGYRIQNYEHKNPGRYKAPNVGILIGQQVIWEMDSHTEILGELLNVEAQLQDVQGSFTVSFHSPFNFT